MNERLKPYFSGKVLFLSIIFILANLGVIYLKSVASDRPVLQSVSPILVFDAGQEIELKSPYDTDFSIAESGQEIYSGTQIRTDEGEFVELKLGENLIRLDELTTVTLVENNFASQNSFASRIPRLSFKLESGGMWVDAFDFIDVSTPRTTVELVHSVGLLTYADPINRLMVVTGDSNLILKNDEGEALSEFVVPIGNQVTFTDSQITGIYGALKPSKLRKELKMTPISREILEDEWVKSAANDYIAEREAYLGQLINSDLSYKAGSGYLKFISALSFVPEARRNIANAQIRNMLRYILGALQDTGDLQTAGEVIAELETKIDERFNDPIVKVMLSKTLFSIENASFPSPGFLLKEVLMKRIQTYEGPGVFRIYLTDLRRLLLDQEIDKAESIAGKWKEKWTADLIENNLDEYSRQSQILNHTIQSHVSRVSIDLLDIFDLTGMDRITFNDDTEETRFEVTQERLQIAAALVSSYRYTLAKQYLKNSYISLNIEGLDESMPSTVIFLETGRLLAQRIEYAQTVLRGTATPIDESRFREFFQAKTRDEALSSDLKIFFDLEQAEAQIIPDVQAPGVMEVVNRFKKARVNLSTADINLKVASGFYYDVVNARLAQRGPNNQTIVFSATYDYTTDSVTDVVTAEKTYIGSFILEDLVKLLVQGEDFISQTYQPTDEDSELDFLITDKEKSEALKGQALAQDLARKLAVSQLDEVGVVIPDVKSNIGILDPVNLDKFEITNALVLRVEEEGTVAINFNYYSALGKAMSVTSPGGVLLLTEVPIKDLASESLARVLELEKEVQTVADFMSFTLQNELTIDPENLIYTQNGMLLLTDLKIKTLGLEVTGLYDSATGDFLSVSHDLLTSQNIGLKEYFGKLAENFIVSYMGEKGITINAGQIDSKYPFKIIKLTGVIIGQESFSFILDISSGSISDVTKAGTDGKLEIGSLDGLKAYAGEAENSESADSEA